MNKTQRNFFEYLADIQEDCEEICILEHKCNDGNVKKMTANRILDVRIPMGTANCLNIGQIRVYADRLGITVMIKEF